MVSRLIWKQQCLNLLELDVMCCLYCYYQTSYFRFYKVAIRTYLLIGRVDNRQTLFLSSAVFFILGLDN